MHGSQLPNIYYTPQKSSAPGNGINNFLYRIMVREKGDVPPVPFLEPMCLDIQYMSEKVDVWDIPA
jgi:hypothetical protein